MSIGDVTHEQGNYREIVVAERGNLRIIDCRIGESTLLLRVEADNRAQEPLAYRLQYDAAQLQEILDSVELLKNTEEFHPPAAKTRR